MSEGFWTSDYGILLRLEALAEAATWQTINNATRILASELGIKRLSWTAEYRGNTPCDYCDGQNGRLYRVGQFLPEMPAHPNCRCHWDILIKDWEPLS